MFSRENIDIIHRSIKGYYEGKRDKTSSLEIELSLRGLKKEEYEIAVADGAQDGARRGTIAEEYYELVINDKENHRDIVTIKEGKKPMMRYQDKTVLKKVMSNKYQNVALKTSEERVSVPKEDGEQIYFKFRGRVSITQDDCRIDIGRMLIIDTEKQSVSEKELERIIKEFREDPKKTLKKYEKKLLYEVEVEYVGAPTAHPLSMIFSVIDNGSIILRKIRGQEIGEKMRLFSIIRKRLIEGDTSGRFVHAELHELEVLHFFVKAISMMKKDISILFDKLYSVSLKVDGYPCLLVENTDNKAYIISMGATDVQVILDDVKNKGKISIFIGECINGNIYIYDTLVFNDKNVFEETLIKRYEIAREHIEEGSTYRRGKGKEKKGASSAMETSAPPSVKVFLKPVLFPSKVGRGKTEEYLNTLCGKILHGEDMQGTRGEDMQGTHSEDMQGTRGTREMTGKKGAEKAPPSDGLVFTEVHAPYYCSSILKWKPPEYNTIDFLISIIEDIKYEKILKLGLYCGIEASQGAIGGLLERKIMDTMQKKNEIIPYRYPSRQIRRRDYMPIPFVIPNENTKTYIAMVGYDRKEVVGKEGREEGVEGTVKYTVHGLKGPVDIEDGTVVEFSWGNHGWIPYKFRDDKTRGFRNNEDNFGNNYTVAKQGWESIVLPVKEEDLVVEKYKENVYFLTKGESDIIKALKGFHNSIKYDIYKRYTTDAEIIVELAGGRANDLNKWNEAGIQKVLVIDIDPSAIAEGKQRYAEKGKGDGTSHDGTEVLFIEKNLLDKSVLGEIKETLFGKKKSKYAGVDAVFCNFAIHYFLESADEILKIKRIVDGILKVNGKFIWMSMDGARVMELFKEKGSDGNIVELKKDNTVVFKLMRLYDATSEASGAGAGGAGAGGAVGVGKKIEVYVESIGSKSIEYLVDFDYIKKLFSNYKTIEDTSFIDLYKNLSGKKKDEFSDAEKTYTGLNRLCVLERVS